MPRTLDSAVVFTEAFPIVTVPSLKAALAFYVGLLSFERDADDSVVVYHAENFRLIFDVLEPPIERDTMRPLARLRSHNVCW